MKIILHLGMPKTGSTFLQWDFFRYARDINFLFKKEGLKKLLMEIRNIDKDIDYEEIKQKFSQYLVNDKPNLVSEENLYCSMWDKRDDRFILLDRIKHIFPNAKIIIGIRDKKKALVSWYKQYVAVGGTFSFDDFIDKVMNLNKLNYEPYIQKLHELFGADNVFVFTMSDLIKNRNETVRKLCEFIGCQIPQYKVWKRNVGYGKNQLKISLFLNQFFKSELNERGVPYPYKKFFLPHRIVFQSRLFSWIPRKKVTLHDLTSSKETLRRIDEVLT
ncbi:MAG: hypothetical protein DRJ99_02410 [Thermoplasmata archaeon]|nr:MAG: hypothetical protein DRJ99_02410 [Thermoplasmata archaeon]